MSKYKNCTDADIIGALIGYKPNAGLVEYFFFDLCKNMLIRISNIMRNDDNYKALVGDFYEYLSKNNWRVLRQYKKKNNATLIYYLSYCTNNHFLAIKKIENMFTGNSDYEFVDVYDELEDEKELMCDAVAHAFTTLNESQQAVLKHLVILEESTLTAADALWKYTKHKEIDWRTLPVKKVQDTLAKFKQRACANLTYKTLERIDFLRNNDTRYLS